MEIKGVTGSILRERIYTLRTDPVVALHLTALPLGWSARLAIEMPRPICKKQKLLHRLGDGTPVMGPDETDAEYMRLDAEYDRALFGAMIHEALRKDTTISFDAKPEAFKTRLAFALAVHEELAVQGFTDAELGKLARAIGELSALDDEALEHAKGFSRVR